MMSIIIPNRTEPRVQEVIRELETILPGSQIIISHDRYSKGKGWATREALKHALGDTICFLDGDMDIEPRMILRLIPFLEDYDIVVGKKDIGGRALRRVITYLSRVYIRALFGIVVNTQTGIKLFKRKKLPDWETNGWGFDIEILAKARKEGYSMIEVPVDAKIVKGVSFKAVLNTFIESINIWLALR